MKSWLILGAGIFAGKFLASFLIKESPDDPTGFIERKPDGFGMDDIAEIGAIAVGIALTKRVLGG